MALTRSRSHRRRRFSHIRLMGLDMEMARGARAYFDAEGPKQFVHTNLNESVADAFILGRTEGVLCLAELYHKKIVQPPASRRTPVVTYGHYGDYPYVIPDYRLAGHLALEHFAQLQLEDVAYVGIPGIDISEDQKSGLSSAGQEAGIRVHVNEVNVFSAMSHGSPEEKPFLHWLRSLPKPVGLLCPLGHVTGYLSILCQRHGILVPDEIALLAGNPVPIACALAKPELSMVEDNHWQIGYEMARLLDQRIRGRHPDPPVIRVPPLRILEAESTNILAVQDSRLRKAILYLREYACGAIQIEDVVAQSGLSRRALELQMQKVLGCTVHQEITRVRIARAKQLLRGSDKSIAEIALECGLQWASSLSTLFARQVGMSPSAYRREMTRQARTQDTP